MAKAAQHQSRAISKRAEDNISVSIKSMLEPLFSATIYGATPSGMVSTASPWKMSDMPDQEKNAIMDKIVVAVSNKDIEAITPDSILSMIAAQPSSNGWMLDLSVAAMKDPKNSAFLDIANNVSGVLISKVKEVRKAEDPAQHTKQNSTQLPQADRGSPIEALSHKLVDRLYLAAPQSTWTPELDKAFREFIDAGTGTKTMSSGADWNAAAPTLGFKPGLSGALAAVTSLMDKVATKPFGDTVAPAATTGTPEAAKPAAPEVAQDTLPAILSVMRQEKMIGTHGADLVNEVNRINVLIEAAGGVNNAAILLHRQDPSLSAALPPKLEGTLTPEFVRRNKALFQSIQGAVNKVIAKQFGPLMPHDKEKAISKLREGLKSASVQDQWVKLASQRKDRIRSEVAAEMTVADKITARRIKARESV
jgi:hypothetical protein